MTHGYPSTSGLHLLRRLSAERRTKPPLLRRRSSELRRAFEGRAAERLLAIKRQTESGARRREAMAHKATAKVSRHDVVTLKSIFDEIDADGDGRVTLDELHSKLRSRRAEATRYDGTVWSAQQRHDVRSTEQSGIHRFADTLLAAMDQGSGAAKGGDGAVEFEELLRVLHPLCTEEEYTVMMAYVTPAAPASPPKKHAADDLSASERDELRDIFLLYDADGSGGLSRAEWAAAAVHCGLSPAESQHLYDTIASSETDASADGEAERDIELGAFVGFMAESAVHWRTPGLYGGLRLHRGLPEIRSSSPRTASRRQRGEARARAADALPPLVSSRAHASSAAAARKTGRARALERKLDASLRGRTVRLSPSAVKYSIRAPARAVMWANDRDPQADEERALMRLVAEAVAF